MESMVEENGSAVDPLSQSSQSGDAAPAIATSVQSLDRTHQQQTHHLVASTSIVQLTLPTSGTTQVYRRFSCVSMSNNFLCSLFRSMRIIIYLSFNYDYLYNISNLDIGFCIMLVVSQEYVYLKLSLLLYLDCKVFKNTSCKFNIFIYIQK